MVRYKSFLYQAASWTRPRRVLANVEFHFGDLFPRVGSILTNGAQGSSPDRSGPQSLWQAAVLCDLPAEMGESNGNSGLDALDRESGTYVQSADRQSVRGASLMRPLPGKYRPSHNCIMAVFALVIYSALSISLFAGLGMTLHLSERFIGSRSDELTQMWALAWWPHALANHLNPFITRVLWPPTGYNLAWTPSIPGPSLVFCPVTRLFGPVVCYNVLCLFCPVAAAHSAFLLCRYISQRFWPSLVGGYVFGLSPYMLWQILGAHLFLLFIFPVPLLIYVVLLRCDQRLNRAEFIGLFVGLLLIEFLSSLELFATTTVFGSLALLLYLSICDGASRRKILAVATESGFAFLITVILVTPYLYYVLAQGSVAPINPGSSYSNDLLTFVIPPATLFVGRSFSLIANRLTLSQVEAAGYLGAGVWIVFVVYVGTFWSTRLARFLVLATLIVSAMSLGPVLHVDGEPVGPGLWWPFSKLPLIDQALPGRFGMYLYLISAVVVSRYLSESRGAVWSRTGLAILCVLFLLPDFSQFRTSAIARVNMPAFIRDGEYKGYIAKDDNVLVLPYAQTEDGLLWQVRADYYFRLAAARLTLPPPEFARWPVLTTFDNGAEIMDFAEQFKAFLGSHQVKAVIVEAQSQQPWVRLLSKAGLSPVAVGGVLFYKVPGVVLDSYRTTTAHQMAEREADISFEALISAANRYIEHGFPLAKLDPWEAHRLNFLDLPEGGSGTASDDSNWWLNLWLGPWGDSLIAVGIVGEYQDIQGLVLKYGLDATDIFFPYPTRLANGRKTGRGQLVMVFAPPGLRLAASRQPH